MHALNWRKHYDSQAEKTQWEIARMLGYWFLQPYDSKKKLKTPKDLVEYPWEESKKEEDELTPEEKEAKEQAKREKFARWDQQMKKSNGTESVTG